MNGKALVTGAGGFIGSHLTESLLSSGWEVRALVHYNSRSHFGWLDRYTEHSSNGLEIVAGDVSDPFQMRELVSGCDVVFHLAALIGIPYSYVAPASYIQTNVTGTLNLAEAALNAGAKRFVHTSTSETYGTALYTPIDERHPMQAQSPYSASKIAADKLIESFVCSFGLPAVTIRPFNTYGPRQSARAVIPTIITQALNGKVVRLGSLSPVRDLTYVGDTVAGFIAVANAPNEANGSVINLGTGTAVSIGELAETIFDILGGEFEIVTDDSRVRPVQSEVMTLISNNTQAKTLLGWMPRISLRAGLEQAVEWTRINRSEFKPNHYAV
jgi:NAD dependent epimerase/dehydratase